jgi:hypothetical protein
MLLLRKFGLVMWKNFILRKRHWIVTSFEIVIPVVLFILAAVIQSQLNTLDVNNVNVSANFFEIENESQMTYSIWRCNKLVLYAPNNSFTSILMGNITSNDMLSFGK